MPRSAKKSRIQRLFPDTKVAAYYDPFSQIINLAKYNALDFKGLSFATPTTNNIDKICLFEHELTHWIDHISTIWGQKNLISLFNALNARANEDINEFWRIKALDNEAKADNFFDYYTEDYGLASDKIKTPWRYQLTCGIRFSNTGIPEHNKPILFTRFASNEDIPILRVPVSIASLLESNAMNSEFRLKLALAHTISDPVDRNLKLTQIQSELNSILYNKDFALYTVGAHLAANIYTQNDVIWAYDVAAAVGTTVLNLPNHVLSQMTYTKVGNEEWNRRIEEFIKNGDKGFAFYNLLKNQADKVGKETYSINDLLKSSNLPEKSKIEEIVIAEMEENISKLIDGPFKRVAENTIKKGMEIFRIRGIDGRNKDFREKLFKADYRPHVIFGDTFFDDSKFEITKALEKLKTEELTIDEHYLVSEFYDTRFEQFVNACGV